jgi:hypothetical protein
MPLCLNKANKVDKNQMFSRPNKLSEVIRPIQGPVTIQCSWYYAEECDLCSPSKWNKEHRSVGWPISIRWYLRSTYISLYMTQYSVIAHTDKGQERFCPLNFATRLLKDWGRIKLSHFRSIRSLLLRITEERGLGNWIMCWLKEWALETSTWHTISDPKET